MDQAQLLRVILSLLFVLVLLLALAWVARNRGWTHRIASGPAIQVLASRRLGARCAITLVEVQGERLLLGVTPQQISLLHCLPADPNAADFPRALREARSDP